jgi:hypothetical protein
MAATNTRILTLNAGSSSVKLAVYVRGADATCVLRGHLSGSGTRNARFSWSRGAERGERIVDGAASGAAEAIVLAWLEEHGELASIDGVAIASSTDSITPGRYRSRDHSFRSFMRRSPMRPSICRPHSA